jgi:membrane fusion protein, multidrug efflux system
MKTKPSIFISIILAFLLISCNKQNSNNSQDPPVPVTVFKVEPANVSYYDTYPGTVTALKEVRLRGQVTGYITAIYFKEGSHVSKGQQLYEIDRRQYEAEYKEANDNLEIARENLAKVQLDVDRYSTLKTQEAIAQQRYDYALTDLANAKLQVSVALQEQVKAKTNLEYSVITAPFNGTIGISQVKMGDLITPGQTLLNTISSDDPMGFDLVIVQSELNRFQQMQNRNLSPKDSTFRLVMPDNSIYQSGGKIDVIDRAIDPQTGTILVRLMFPNPTYDLRPGMVCNIRVIHESGGPQIMIPFKAVVEQMGEYFVFLAENNKVTETKVTIGSRVGSGVLIQKGLKAGDVIAVDGIEKLIDGTSIMIGPPLKVQNKSKKS